MEIVFVYVLFLIIFSNHSSGEYNTGQFLYPAWVAVDAKGNSKNILISIYKDKNNTLAHPSPVNMALESFPLIDGHNDLPFLLHLKLNNNLTNFDLNTNLNFLPGWEKSHTDIPRLKQGRVGGQFWSAFVFCQTQYKDAVAKTMEQIDLIKRMVEKFSAHLQFATTADGILDAFKNGKIASLIGIEGGHSIDSRLSVLRLYYELGARYLTLTHTCNTPWSTTAIGEDDNAITTNAGLTSFGKKVVLEMNRLGMLVDLSHVSKKSMIDALTTSVAPVIFSHSSSYWVFSHPRNVEDDILRLLKQNRGIIMVTFYPDYVGGGDNADLSIIVDHINHIVDEIGVEHVGLGSDFDGIPMTPIGLEDVSKYPDLLEALYLSNPERWTQRNLEKLIGRNLIRVFREVEKVKAKLTFAEPIQDEIPINDLDLVSSGALEVCRTSAEHDSQMFERLFNKLTHPQNERKDFREDFKDKFVINETCTEKCTVSKSSKERKY